MRLTTTVLTAVTLLLASAWVVVFTRPIQTALLQMTPTDAPLIQRLETTQALLDYYAGRAPLLVEMSAREAAHLADVRALVTSLRVITAFALAMLLAIVAILLHRKQHRQLVSALRLGANANAITVITLLLLMAVSFSWSFDLFHRMAFRNDLWLLPPGSLLLKLYPPNYFALTATTIIGLDLALVMVTWIVLRRK